MAYTELQKQQHIRELQGYLHGISHIQQLPHVIPDGIYGEKTIEAIRQFQQQNHMPATGETDTATWNAVAQAYLQEVRPPVLHLALFPTGITAYTLGDTGGAVFVIQGILQAIQNNFPKIPPISGTRIGSSNSMGALPHKQQVSNQPDTRLDQVCDRVVKNAQHKNSHDQDGGSRGEGPVRSQIPRMHVG